jgi:ADP-ribose pyrophosphatase YjhB (NUDIX family)
VRKVPKRLLLELPLADEIDKLATTTPHFEVRKFEFDMGKDKADLNYAPCKGEMVLVIVGEKGIALVGNKGSEAWRLPSGRIHTHENAIQAAKRLAKEECGLHLKSLELSGMYDVVWHYADISVKRLHLLYSAVTEDCECGSEGRKGSSEARFFAKVPESVLENELMRSALADCSEK